MLRRKILNGLTKYAPCWNEADRFLLQSTLFSVSLILARMLYTGSDQFLFLVWNLFLAFLPYAQVKGMLARPGLMQKRWVRMSLIAVWMLFLPNSFYILTDLLHLNGRATVMKWFDVTLIVSFAWNGVLLGVLAIRGMERMLSRYLGRRRFVYFLAPVMLLNGLGVYIGRYLRFNSWDVLSNPFGLAGDLYYLLRHPLLNSSEWAMIGCFSGFMLLLYISFRKLARVM